MKKLVLLLNLLPLLAMGQGHFEMPDFEISSTVEGTVEMATAETIKIDGGCEVLVPKSVEDLDSGLEFKYTVLQGDASGSLKLLGFGSLSANKKMTYVVIEYMQYKNCSCAKTGVSFGAGLRAVLSVKKWKGNAESVNLPKIAGEVSAGKMTASLSVTTVGLTGQGAIDALPSNLEFNVESYTEFLKVMDMVSNMYDPSKVNVVPQVLPYFVPDQSKKKAGKKRKK